MSLLTQPALEEDLEPYVFHLGAVQAEYSVCQFVVDLEAGEPTTQVILIIEFEGKKLVAFPAAVWHRNPQRRVLPAQCLRKPITVEG